jgi:hypothetical protein
VDAPPWVLTNVLVDHRACPTGIDQLPHTNEIPLPRGQLEQVNVHFTSS